jgi:hypothetical protein
MSKITTCFLIMPLAVISSIASIINNRHANIVVYHVALDGNDISLMVEPSFARFSSVW